MQRREFLIGAPLAALLAGAAQASTEFYSGYPHEIRDWHATYFRPEEFASRGNGYVHVRKDMIHALDRIRAEMERPMIVLSGYRDKAYNRKIGGARFSRHVVGDAVDLSMSGMTDPQRYKLMSLLMAEGFHSYGTYGRYPNMLHADMRRYARIWRHGGGTHPRWFQQALSDWGWQRDAGPTRRPQTLLTRS